MNQQRHQAAFILIGKLAERFPAASAINPRFRQPLKLGIHVDILAQLSDTIAPRDLSTALRIYVGNVKYLNALVAGAERVDLNGLAAGVVTAEHAAIAKDRCQLQPQRRHDKKLEVPKPVAAVTPSAPRSRLADLRAAAKARQAVAAFDIVRTAPR